MREKIAVFPGSFDPFTKGHEEVVHKALKIFDKVVIGIGVNAEKKRYFSASLMCEKISELFKELSSVTVKEYSGLTVDFAAEEHAEFIVRGLRNTTDFEFEKNIALINESLNGNIFTLFIPTSSALSYISSTMVRDVYRSKKDIGKWVPYII